MSRIKVAIFIFPGVEVLDFAGPYEVFTTASRVQARMHPAAPQPFEVFTIAQDVQPIKARAGLAVLADYTSATHPPIDLLIVPGGVVTEELNKPAIITWLAATAAQTQITASVCTGAFLLAKAGLLNRKRVTTHWEDIADLRHDFPALQVIDSTRWVDAGEIVTSGGISAGIDMSLHLVERLAGRELALKTARQMDYRWEENC
jgi:transcriptional regulator GlxA family with amidase domain